MPPCLASLLLLPGSVSLLVLLLLGCATTSSVNAFSLSSASTTSSSSSARRAAAATQFHHQQRQRRQQESVFPTSLFSSAPSDTTDEDEDYSQYGYGPAEVEDAVVTVESEDGDETPGEALVTNILDLLPSDFTQVSSEQRSAINEVLYQLEGLNPTSDSPAMSPLINGIWELKYVGGYSQDWALPSPTRQLALFLYSGGYSPGVFAYTIAQNLPFVKLGKLQITIQRNQPRVEASLPVTVFGTQEGTVIVTSRLEVESSMRLRETYESASISNVIAAPMNIPSPLQYSRDLYVTYVDDDLLIVRDGSGIPEVLVRQEKQFSKNWGVEPSDLDDLVPPGDGEDAQF